MNYLGLYGKIIIRPVAYCKKHKCYLAPRDIKEKKCNWKECKNMKVLIRSDERRKKVDNFL